MSTTWFDLGIDVGGRTFGNHKTKCPKNCSAKSGKKDLSVNLDNGAYRCHNPGCDFAGYLETSSKSPFHIGRSAGYDRDRFRKPDAEDYHGKIGKFPPEAVAQMAARGISVETLNHFRVGWHDFVRKDDETGKWQGALLFPFYRDDVLVNTKKRTLDKRFGLTAGAELILFNLDARAETTIIVEGELDVLAMYEAGITNVVSVPNGAPSGESKAALLDYLDNCGTELEDVKHFILAVDGDGPGMRLRDELAHRIGQEICSRVEWPEGAKDANDVLRMPDGANLLRAVVAAARPYPVTGIARPKTDLRDALDNWRINGLPSGSSTGWDTLDDLWRPVPGEMTIITGVPSHGKSTWCDALLMNLYDLHGWRSIVFSPENYPTESHAAKMLEIEVGKSFDESSAARWRKQGIRDVEVMTDAEYELGLDVIEDAISYIVQDSDGDGLSLDQVLAKARGEIYRRGAKVLVIDPWNEIEHDITKGMSETLYISYALGKIRRFARHCGVHIFIVAHPTKLTPQTEKYKDELDNEQSRNIYPVPDLYHISGCYADDTEVLTRTGWKKHGEVGLEDQVACFDPKHDHFYYAHPSKIWQYDYSGPMHRFRSVTFDCLVTPNHRMVVGQTWRRRKPMIGSGLGRPRKYEDGWSFVEAKDLAGNLVVPLASPRVDSRSDRAEIYGKPADDMLKFLGWWIAEGCTQMGQLSICQAVGPIQAEMKATMDRLSLDYTDVLRHPTRENERTTMWVARIKGPRSMILSDAITSVCGVGCENKRLPDFTWNLSARQQRILLEALIDGDGSRNPNGSSRYSTTSSLLADQVQRLAIELGHPSIISSQPPAQPHHKRRYQVTIGRSERATMMLRKDRHHEIVQYSGKVHCLTVPTGAYITRRNGKMMIAGNSAAWKNKADNGISIWRDEFADAHGSNPHLVTVVVTKVKRKWVGRKGALQLIWSPVSGRFAVPSKSQLAGPGAPRTAAPASSYPDHFRAIPGAFDDAEDVVF